MQLAAVCILTDNAPRLAAFYEKVLREKPLVDGNHYGFAQLAVYDSGDVKVATDKNMSVILMADDLKAEYDRLTREIPDLVVTSPPQRRPWGAYSFWFTDPDGNSVSVFEQQSGGGAI